MRIRVVGPIVALLAALALSSAVLAQTPQAQAPGAQPGYVRAESRRCPILLALLPSMI